MSNLLKNSIICLTTILVIILMNGCANNALTPKDVKNRVCINKQTPRRTVLISGALPILKFAENEQKVKDYIRKFKSYKYHAVSAQKYADAILFACLKYDIDLDVMLSLIKHESGFRASVVQATTGCIGACQINPNVWTEELVEQGLLENKEDLFNIFNNVMAGAYILRSYLNRTGDMEAALRRYYGICNYATTYSKNVLKG